MQTEPTVAAKDAAPRLPKHPAKRRWPVAVILNLIGPGSGYLYVGRPKRALIAAGTDVVFQIVMWTGLGGWLAEPWVIVLVLGLVTLINIAFLVDAARIAIRSGDYKLRFYNRGWIYVSVIIAIIALEGLDQIPATGIKPSVSFVSGSPGMASTLGAGEYAVADMRAFDTREPRPGEVVVFRLPRDPSTWAVRRVIGLPSDRVLPGHYMLMDDHRDDSTADSREPSEFHYVPRANIIGRVSWVVWSSDFTRIGARAK
jgi:Signal peptidase, peptidase S26